MTYHSNSKVGSSPTLLLSKVQDSMTAFIIEKADVAKFPHANSTVALAENTMLFQVCMMLWNQPVLLSDREYLEACEEITELAFSRSRLFNKNQFDLWSYRK